MNRKLIDVFEINFFKIVFVITIFIYGLSVYNSSGFYHEDEHYQIIQFAEYKLGNTQEITWEYKEEIRSTIQPIMVMGVFLLMRFVGVHDPFYLVLALRIISALFALLAITLMINCFLGRIKNEYKWLFIFLSYLLWFLPYLNVRFSSENWSGIFLILASVYGLVSKSSKEKQTSFFLVC